MTTFVVTGPTHLSGTVSIQGAKNSAMKHVLLPLLTNNITILRNLPQISSITNLLNIVKLQGAVVTWLDPNTVQIDTRQTGQLANISADLFYHTSGAVFLIPLLIQRFGRCCLETDPSRSDTGGDQIGRSLDFFDQVMSQIGIVKTTKNNISTYTCPSQKPFTASVNNGSFGTSVLLLFSALSRQGVSRLIGVTQNSEFMDSLRLLQKMGLEVNFVGSDLLVVGNITLHGVDFINMSDKHDFATFVSAALTTQSSITIKDYDFDQMKLQPLADFFCQIGLKNFQFDNHHHSFIVPQTDIKSLHPVNLIASDFPNFITEWQVLFSPLLALIPGQSEIIEGWFFDRMRHWSELAILGAKYQYFTHPGFPEKDSAPRAVRVTGVDKLFGATVTGRDLRSTAALIIASLAADGQTTITDSQDNITRGYENFATRLISLGANIIVNP